LDEKAMKLKFASLVSICLNLILVVWVMVLLRLLAARTGAVGAPATPTGGSEPSIPAAHQSSVLKPGPQPADATRNTHFDWRQVESEDYRQYLANSRAIGCPGKTIRDIIVADVNDLFASKSASLTKTNEYQYWRREPVSRSKEQVQQQQDLYAQKRELLKALGVDAPDFSDLLGEAFRDHMEERDLQVAFLPEYKRQQVKQTLFEQAQQEVAEGNSVARYDAIEQGTQARVQSLLTPEELKEYELRCSTDALQLRGVLDSTGLAEQEFRTIFDSWRSLKGFSPGTVEYREAQQSSETTIRQLLGPDRFQSYLGGVKLLGYSQ
jgi:hypothetical protein